MPNLDGTGPEKKGSIDGRKLGKCAQKSTEEPTKYKIGQGMGKRRRSASDEIFKH